jgi:cytochrome oxidase Cu insertion factor (SCO1/SenC/PrrC family)
MFLNKKLKSFGIAALALYALAWVANAPAAEGLFPAPTVMAPPPQPARLPEFELTNLNGGVLKSSEMKGKVIIIRFWATW